jgi:hypothetical protein
VGLKLTELYWVFGAEYPSEKSMRILKMEL